MVVFIFVSHHELKMHNFDTTVCTVDFFFKLHKVVKISIKVSKGVVNLYNFLMDQIFVGVLTN